MMEKDCKAKQLRKVEKGLRMKLNKFIASSILVEDEAQNIIGHTLNARLCLLLGSVQQHLPSSNTDTGNSNMCMRAAL